MKQSKMNQPDQIVATDIENQDGILFFLPMLYVAWSDCVLTPTEMGLIRERISSQNWLHTTEKNTLIGWLDPANPPSPLELRRWLHIIRNAGNEIPMDARQSLVNLGIEIARVGSKETDQRCNTPQACAALADIEKALGIVSSEAIRELFVERRTVKIEPEADKQRSSFDLKKMTGLLDGDFRDVRQKVKKVLADPVFKYSYNHDSAIYREYILDRCRDLAAQGLGSLAYPEQYGGTGDFAQSVAAFETLAYHDLSLAIKYGVQFGLFGGSIYHLGTNYHHNKYLNDAGSLQLPGCFAMTELGHGSNVWDIETQAKYDSDSKEFIIHTPSEPARKEYIGNAALHGEMATVFAQLDVAGEELGVHAFLVPLRDKSKSLLPGIRIEDCGEKMGLNGVDNGRIWFDQVRIPRKNLLNRYADVAENGTYSSSISSNSQRFFTMLGTLVGGRISIAAASVSASKSALTIALRYATQRRQFGPGGVAETLLIDYPSHQQRLIPLLAGTYALNFAIRYLVNRYNRRTDQDSREVEVLAAGIKAYSSWHATHTIQTGRESCGGIGYLVENRFADLKADTDIFSTFEGDNTVLMQLVARGILSDFKQQFNHMKFFDMLKFLASRAGGAILDRNPLVIRQSDESHLRAGEFQLTSFQNRERELIFSVSKRLKAKIESGIDSFAAFTQCQTHLIALAHAHIERIILEQFYAVVESVSEPDLKDILQKLAGLFALSRLYQDRGWFLEHGFFDGVKTKAIRKQVEILCAELSSQVVPLADAFAIPDDLLGAPIALKK